MAYAPGIQNRAGELMAAGIDRGISAIAGALIERAEKRRQKEEWGKAAASLQPLVDKLAPDSGIKLDKDTPKELVPQMIQVATQLERDQREKPLRDLQLENEKLRQRISQQQIDEAATNAAALGATAPLLRSQVDFPAALRRDAQGQPPPMRPADYSGALSTYLGRGGTDPRMVAQLGELAERDLRTRGRPSPGLQTFGNDAWGRPVQGLVDAQGNVSRIAPPTADQEVAQPFEINGKQFFRVGSAVLDGEGRPVRAETRKELDPMAANIAYTAYTSAVAQAEQAAQDLESSLFWKRSGAEERLRNARGKANLLARKLDLEAPFDETMAAVADAPARKPAATASAQPAATSAKPAATPYSSAEIQAELKRRKLIP